MLGTLDSAPIAREQFSEQFHDLPHLFCAQAVAGMFRSDEAEEPGAACFGVRNSWEGSPQEMLFLPDDDLLRGLG